ncbi:cyclic nucleotide-binding/CBS domain-containing protein, partial [Bacteroidota bacterium]
KDIGSIVVMNEEKVIGIMTEYDVVAEIIEDAEKCNQTKVSDVMITPVMTINGDTNIFEANRIMVSDNVRRLPITEGEDLKGIITQTDMCRAIFYFLKSAFWHSHKEKLVWEKLEKRTVEKRLI